MGGLCLVVTFYLSGLTVAWSWSYQGKVDFFQGQGKVREILNSTSVKVSEKKKKKEFYFWLPVKFGKEIPC